MFSTICLCAYLYRYLNMDMFVFIFIFFWTSYHEQFYHHIMKTDYNMGLDSAQKILLHSSNPPPHPLPPARKGDDKTGTKKKQYMRAALSERRSRKQSQQCHHNNRIGLTIWRTICVFPSYRGWIIESGCPVITMTAGLQWIKRSTD